MDYKTYQTYTDIQSALNIRQENVIEILNLFVLISRNNFVQHTLYEVIRVPCNKIDALFGHQRVKGLSITSVLIHMLKKSLGKLNTKNIETSLIEQFKYPKLGPGQLWENVSQKILDLGGET